jgi:hypothetical protein
MPAVHSIQPAVPVCPVQPMNEPGISQTCIRPTGEAKVPIEYALGAFVCKMKIERRRGRFDCHLGREFETHRRTSRQETTP